MLPYVVKQGDYLEKLAHAQSFDADAVWNDPKNAELKSERDPNILHPGDVLYVPERKEPQPSLHLATGSDNLYVADVPRVTVCLVFRNLDMPRAAEPYVVGGLGEPEEGVTDPDGRVELQVPVHVREVQVVFPKANVAYPIRVGDMDPIDQPSGVRKRLLHLGYYVEPSPDAGEGDEEVSEQAAIHAFQMANDLLPTGLLDDETRAQLLSQHGV